MDEVGVADTPQTLRRWVEEEEAERNADMGRKAGRAAAAAAAGSKGPTKTPVWASRALMSSIGTSAARGPDADHGLPKGAGEEGAVGDGVYGLWDGVADAEGR